MKLKHTFTCFNNNNNNNSHVITEILDRPKQQKDPPKPGSRVLQFLTAINGNYTVVSKFIISYFSN